jgi:hypothetical protein
MNRLFTAISARIDAAKIRWIDRKAEATVRKMRDSRIGRLTDAVRGHDASLGCIYCHLAELQMQLEGLAKRVAKLESAKKPPMKKTAKPRGRK